MKTWSRLNVQGRLGYPRPVLICGTNIQFVFTDKWVSCLGSDVNLSYPRDVVRGFEAWVE
jgi:hypothetical protein